MYSNACIGWVLEVSEAWQIGSDEQMYRDVRHSGIYSNSLLGEAGNQVKVGVWGPRRLMSYADW